MRSAKSRVLNALRGYRVSRVNNDRAIRLFLEALDTPRSLAVWMLYESKEYEQLVRLECNPGDYADTAQFRDDYAATKFLSKYKSFETGIDKRKVALDGWKAAEEHCRVTNSLLQSPSFEGPEKDLHSWLLNATKRKIGQILNNEFDPNEWLDACSWGPGATFHMKGADTGPESKFLLEGGITHSLFPLVKRCWSSEFPTWFPKFELTRGNRVLTVDKNAKTDRVIAAEPGINLWFQLGLGALISRRLRRFGIDIRSQDRNQLLAYFGSRSDSVATVDFSSASDMISYVLVEQLLPGDWFHALDLCRSQSSLVDGHWVELEKFSSMGNGFTFPLQTLIFFAAALAVCEYVGVESEHVSVYGDDVIIPVEAYATYVKFCEFIGFSVNESKSYSSGPFRESCGSHYFRGVDVKPLYFKEALRDVSSVFKLANAIKRLARRDFYHALDGRFFRCWKFLYEKTPKLLRFHTPEGVGDAGFTVEFDHARPHTRSADGFLEGYLFRALVAVPVRRSADHHGVLLARLSELGASLDMSVERSTTFAKKNFCSLRRATKYVVKNNMFHRRWDSGGVWIIPGSPFNCIPA